MQEYFMLLNKNMWCWFEDRLRHYTSRKSERNTTVLATPTVLTAIFFDQGNPIP